MQNHCGKKKNKKVCGRAAVAMVAPATVTAPTYNPFCGVHWSPTWEWCMAPTEFSCICFAKCFELALQQACRHSKACCAEASVFPRNTTWWGTEEAALDLDDGINVDDFEEVE